MFRGKAFILALALLASSQVWASGIVGKDERTRLNLSNFPWLGKVGVNANDLGCSATLISPRVVLAAGHCVADYNHKHFAYLRSRQMVFSLRHTGHGEHLYSGQVVAAGARVFKPKAYGFKAERVWLFEPGSTLAKEILRQQHMTSEDWALIVLDEEVSGFSRFPRIAAANQILKEGLSLSCAGYPGDLDDGEYAYISSGKLRQGALAWNEKLEVDCDIAKGMSGGAVYEKAGNEFVLQGVISALGNTNGEFGNRVAPTFSFAEQIEGLLAAESQDRLESYVMEQRLVNTAYYLTNPNLYYLTESWR